MIHPKFKSLPFLGGGHRQTLAAILIKGKRQPYQAIQHVFDLDDVDRTILHDDCPPGWTDANPVALLLHGLAGCYGSDYMVRIAAKLNQLGVRTFRMDLRDCGAAKGMAGRFRGSQAGSLRHVGQVYSLPANASQAFRPSSLFCYSL